MPIYAYRCTACGHAKDVLQKISDPLLSTCPACGADSFRKQLTAAGFQLKGSGWYATDFRNGSGGKPAAPAGAAAEGDAPKSDAPKTDAPKTDAGSTPAAPAAKPSPVSASASAASGGASSSASQ